MQSVAIVAVVAAVGVLGVGCSAKVDDAGVVPMSAVHLQEELADRMAKGRVPPQSVTCAGDLPGEVGKTVICEVVLTDTEAMQATVTTTKVTGSTIDYDVSPSVTKDQLEKAYAFSESAQAVKCDAGLDGKVGASTTCQVTKDGATRKTTVSVKRVADMQIDFATG